MLQVPCVIKTQQNHECNLLIQLYSNKNYQCYNTDHQDDKFFYSFVAELVLFIIIVYLLIKQVKF